MKNDNPYKKILQERADKMVKNPTPSESIIYRRLMLIGERFVFQFIKGYYIADFLLVNKNIILEIDGSSHDDKQEYDAKRDNFFNQAGYRIIHIKNKDVETVNLNFSKSKKKKNKERFISLAQKVKMLKAQTKRQKLKALILPKPVKYNQSSNQANDDRFHKRHPKANLLLKRYMNN